MKPTYKSKLRSLVIAAILILAGTLMVTANTGIKPALADVANATQIENDFSVEDWMVNLNKWTPNQEVSIMDVDFENGIEIESWMLEANSTNWNTSDESLEEEIVVEDWMTNLSKW